MTSNSWKRWLVPGSSLSTAEPVRADLHTHTLWTDGKATVPEMIAAARAQGLQAIAITEHANFSTDWYADFANEVRSVREEQRDVDVFFGVEVAALDYEGSLKAAPELIGQAEIVMGVVHSYPKKEGGYWSFKELDPEVALEMEIAALCGLARNPGIDIIGHPGGTYYGKFGPFPVERLATVFEAAKSNSIAVDFNARHCWDPAGMLCLLREIDPLVALGSDAHDTSGVGSPQRLLRSLDAGSAREGGIGR